MKLTTNTQVSVDGVMQANGGRNEQLDPGMERGGWARPLFDEEAMAFVDQFYERADAFLFGRRTYEIFAASWGTWDDPGDSPIWTALNTTPKYVASTTPFDPEWAKTTVLSRDLAAAVRELKAKAGGELQVHGSGVLVHGCSTTTSSTRSICSSAPSSSARARGCSPTPAGTSRSSWWNRGPPPGES